MTDQRLVEIESKVAYQEVKIEELNLLVNEQQALVRKLEEAVRVLASSLRGTSVGPMGPSDQKPPHY